MENLNKDDGAFSQFQPQRKCRMNPHVLDVLRQSRHLMLQGAHFSAFWPDLLSMMFNMAVKSISYFMMKFLLVVTHQFIALDPKVLRNAKLTWYKDFRDLLATWKYLQDHCAKNFASNRLVNGYGGDIVMKLVKNSFIENSDNLMANMLASAMLSAVAISPKEKGHFKDIFSQLYALSSSKSYCSSIQDKATRFVLHPIRRIPRGVNRAKKSIRQLGVELGSFLSLTLPSADIWNLESGEYGVYFFGAFLLV
ncbi:hypothetical protein Tco_0276803 [Tanacetum coccineum]